MYRLFLLLVTLATLQPASLLAQTSEQIREQVRDSIYRDTNYKNDLEFFCVISRKLRNPPRSEAQNVACGVIDDMYQGNENELNYRVCDQINKRKFYWRNIDVKVSLPYPVCQKIYERTNSQDRVALVNEFIVRSVDAALGDLACAKLLKFSRNSPIGVAKLLWEIYPISKKLVELANNQKVQVDGAIDLMLNGKPYPGLESAQMKAIASAESLDDLVHRMKELELLKRCGGSGSR